MPRDNFTESTKNILAKRVGFLCSNPNCKRHTVGPNEEHDKATILGIAAHITAASPGGPRYDSKLPTAERKHINNGIWLCVNCATLIDKNESAFSVELLHKWKETAEMEMSAVLSGNSQGIKQTTLNPYIEADLIWSHGLRGPRGYSEKNLEKFGGNIIPVGGQAIIFWELKWNFAFVLHNNSSYPAFNLRIQETGNVKFSTLSKIQKINNLPPYASIDLKAQFEYIIEGEHSIADQLMKERIPRFLDGLQLQIDYQDENREAHQTIVQIVNQNLVNSKIQKI